MSSIQTLHHVADHLRAAQKQALALFDFVEHQNVIVPGKTESQLIAEIEAIANTYFGIEKFWHKKIVRIGVNTLQPFDGNPPDQILRADDILFLDFGPIYNGYEADLGRTYVLGHNPQKLKLKQDLEIIWQEARNWYFKQTELTGAQFFKYVVAHVQKYGYEFGNEIAGHIVGPFPHEQLGEGNLGLDIHPDNHQDILQPDPQGQPRHWILEIHLVNRAQGIGGFFEQLLQ